MSLFSFAVAFLIHWMDVVGGALFSRFERFNAMIPRTIYISFYTNVLYYYVMLCKDVKKQQQQKERIRIHSLK